MGLFLSYRRYDQETGLAVTMVQSDRDSHLSQPAESGEHKQNRLSQIREKTESSVQQHRRSSMIRMLTISVVIAALVIVLPLLGREWLARRECINGMKELGQQITEFEKTYNHLPSREQILEFELKSRLNVNNVKYDKMQILPDSPDDTPLAYYPLIKLRFISSGHAMLERSGQVRWINEKALQEKLEQRERHYNSKILEKNP